MLSLTLLLLIVCLYIWVKASNDDENILLKRMIKKIEIYCNSIIFMMLSKESKGLAPKYNKDPSSFINSKIKNKKTIIFLRHGESDWNNVSNKGINIGMIKRMFLAIIDEIKYFATDHSVFIDSPLNMEGIEQGVLVSKFLQDEKNFIGLDVSTRRVIDCLIGKDNDKKSSVIVSSSLRRAIATTTLALWHRIEKTNEKIIILSSLQEISRNVDTYGVSDPNTVADLPFSRIAPHCGGDNFNPKDVYDATENFGTKTRSFHGIKRLTAFNEWVFKREEEIIIVGGHSLWFKYFFQNYLPHQFDHIAKTKKIANSGMVAFDLYLHELEDGSAGYRVDNSTVKIIYGGFTAK